MSQNDLIIIEKVIAGDVQSYSILVDNYKDMAMNLAYNILLNREDAEEVAQDAFVKAYLSLRSFKAAAKFSTWLYRIIVNTALNKKKARNHHVVELTVSMESEQQLETDESISAYLNNDHKKYVQHAIRHLSPDERICITLFYLDELSVDEINEVTGITTANIKVLLYRARKKLYVYLKKYLKDEINNLIEKDMEEDKNLKSILLKSAELTSDGFTNNIMARINDLSLKPAAYRPLVSDMVKKAFIYTFIAVFAGALLTCLLLTFNDINMPRWMHIPGLPPNLVNKISGFIFSFGIVFLTNFLSGKNNLKLSA